MHSRNRLRHRLLAWTTVLVVVAMGMAAIPGAPFAAIKGGAQALHAQELSQQIRVFLPLINKEAEAQTSPITSEESNIVSTPSGVRMAVLAGSVPQQADGSRGVTNFSIEAGVQPPAPLPEGFQPVSSVIKFGPEGFTFAMPIEMTIPVSSDIDRSQLRLLLYAPDTGEWIPYPLGLQGDSVNIAGYDLGYAVVGVQTGSTASQTGSTASASQTYRPWISGGFRWNRTSCPAPFDHLNCGYNFSIIDSNATSPSEALFISNCSQAGGPHRCIVMRTGSAASTLSPRCYERIDYNDPDAISDPDYYSTSSEYCVFPLPRGSYQLCVEAWEAPMTVPGPSSLRRWTYSQPARVTLDRPMTRSSPGWESPWRGTRPVVLDPGGTWQEGAACPKPAPTVPVGTGELQATLTWVNTAARATDLDLHLYGPDGLHIYYGNPGPQNNLRLDRDWLREPGNAAENIFSVGSPLPRGSYRLTVHLYSGAPTNYSVRFLYRGSVRSFTNSINSGEQEILRFTIE